MENSAVNGKIGKICKYFASSGYCFYGDSCQFVHSKGKVESPLSVDDSVITSSGGAAALMPRVANVPRQLKYGESRSTPSSPKKNQIQNQRPSPNEDVSRAFQRLNFDATPVQAPHFQAPNLPRPFTDQVKKENPSFFVSQQIKLELQRQQTIALSHSADESLPANVDSYHSLCQLEDVNPSQQTQSLLRCVSTCYKAVCAKDGQTYCLRRIHGYRLVNPKAFGVIEQWKKVQNTNIVPLIEVFTTKAFGDNSLIFVYGYYPGAETLMARHFSPAASTTGSYHQNNAKQSHHPLWTPKHKYSAPVPAQRVIPERLLWNYIIQLTGAMRLVHSIARACRVIDPSKILLIGNSRLRINCVGILDVLTNDANSSAGITVPHHQQEDLVALGKLILALACYSIDSVHQENIQQSLEFVAKNYSNDLKSLVWHLLSTQHQNQSPKSINDVMPVIGARFYSQLDAMQGRYDILERELSKELESGRILRILTKISTILERPEFNMDPEWSETGDRYLLKLFRDYVFHQVTDTGTPWVDLAHIVSCLNKLDAGSTDRICLTSRDDQSVLVVSYHDLKACLETAFNDLVQAQAGIRT
eukprot:Seg1690.2 transcript_id=Seg1690.2/GoldUCD/mRNA.D3Y31 product="PAN2-PAN3 deadenylation complex subunit pan3" protein_id=Seg1690.2/GoldUCD/D3Y31